MNVQITRNSRFPINNSACLLAYIHLLSCYIICHNPTASVYFFGSEGWGRKNGIFFPLEIIEALELATYHCT